MTATAGVNPSTSRLAEPIKQVPVGNEALLTPEPKPVAKIISTSEREIVSGTPPKIHSFKGHRILTPVSSPSKLAEETFSHQ